MIWLWRLCPPLFADLKPQVSAYKIQIAAAPAIARMNNAGIALDLDAHAERYGGVRRVDEIASAAYRDACIEIGRPELAERSPTPRPRSRASLTRCSRTPSWRTGSGRRRRARWRRARPALQMAAHYPPIPPLIELTTLKGLAVVVWRQSSLSRQSGDRPRASALPIVRRAAQAARRHASRIFRARRATCVFAALFRAADGYVLVRRRLSLHGAEGRRPFL